MRRARRLGAAVIFAAVIAILGSIPTAAQAGSQVPFRFTLSVHDTSVTQDCPSLCFTSAGTGTATQLGAFTLSGFGVATSVSFLSATQFAVTTLEQYVLTAANGDTIELTNQATAVEDLTTGVAPVTGQWQITGGTGRFSGASGQGMTTGTIVANDSAGTLDGTFTSVGLISTVGSLR